MNDTDVLTAVKQSYAGVHLDIPLDAVVRRGLPLAMISLRLSELPDLTAIDSALESPDGQGDNASADRGPGRDPVGGRSP